MNFTKLLFIVCSILIISHNIGNPVEIIETVNITKKVKKINESIPFQVIWSKKCYKNLRKVELQKGIAKNVTKKVKKMFYSSILHNTNVVNKRTVAKEYYRLILFNKDSTIEKIYDLSKVKKIKMIATAYYPGDPLAWKDGTITFLGQKMQRGIVAVDPKIIPLKTRLFISGYGYGYAGDIGGLIKGKRIDLGVENIKEEKFWMFKDVDVYVLEKAETY